jgi:hypothetical protein
VNDLGQALIFAAVAVYTGWVVVDALRTGTLKARTSMQRQREPGLFWFFIFLHAALCLLALRILAFGLLGW